MTDNAVINTPAEANSLPPGQWVTALDNHRYCLVDTRIVSPQRMWMHRDGDSYVAVDRVPYPLRLADIDEPGNACLHLRTQECGHCRRCGRVVAGSRPVRLDGVGGMTVVSFGGGSDGE